MVFAQTVGSQPQWIYVHHVSWIYDLGEGKNDCGSHNTQKSVVKQFLLEWLHKLDQNNCDVNGQVNMKGEKVHEIPPLVK